MSSLLPKNSTSLEKALESAMALAFALPSAIRDAWNPYACPADMLPWLAQAFGVEEWQDDWPEGRKRGAIDDALIGHKRKGSVWSVRRVLSRLGFASALIQEGMGYIKYDGAHTYNGAYTYGNPADWAKYRIVIVNRAVPNAEGESMRRALAAIAPARCQLAAIDFTAIPLNYDGNAYYDGAYNFGVIT